MPEKSLPTKSKQLQKIAARINELKDSVLNQKPGNSEPSSRKENNLLKGIFNRAVGESIKVKGTNLLDDVEISPIPWRDGLQNLDELKEIKKYYHSPWFISTSQFLIISVFIVFVTLSVMNGAVNRSVEREFSALAANTSEIEEYSEGMLDLLSIGSRIDILKRYDEEYRDVASITELILETPYPVEFISCNYSVGSISFQANFTSPVVFALLAEDFLESDYVESITLNSAVLNPQDRTYGLGLEVNLK